jgi:hypothetical protein
MNFNNKDFLPVSVKGHVRITDDLNNVLLDKTNAIHPENMARVFARALSNENNFYIYRMAFGNGGTIVDAAYTITYKTPNDGQAPDTAGWKSSLYNETYSEIVDDSSALDDTGPGASPINDVAKNSVVSSESGLISSVTVSVTLNPFEPAGQSTTDILPPSESTGDAFVFDEIGLYTTGAPHNATLGYQEVNVSNKLDTDSSGLAVNTNYTFTISVDGGTAQVITIDTGIGSGAGGDILFSDLTNIINSVLVGATVAISNASGTVNTFGNLRFVSNSSGSTSSINITTPSTIPSNWLFSNLTGFGGSVSPAVAGQDQGFQNDPTNPALEGERLLTHLIFSPVRKSANRTLTIKYVLSIQVARST